LKAVISKDINIEITQEDFMEYEDCRVSGVTNMLDLRNVQLITGLSKDKIKAIKGKGVKIC
jgi:hypothetical protein